jgi:hypothetical protein
MWGGIDQQLYGIGGGRSAMTDTVENDLANAALILDGSRPVSR